VRGGGKYYAWAIGPFYILDNCNFMRQRALKLTVTILWEISSFQSRLSEEVRWEGGDPREPGKIFDGHSKEQNKREKKKENKHQKQT